MTAVTGRLPALQLHAGRFEAGGHGLHGDVAGGRSRLHDGQATALKSVMRVRLAILDAVHVAVANADDFGRPRQVKFHFRVRIRNANTACIHDSEFNVADIFAVGAKLRRVGQEFNPARRARCFQNAIANLAAIGTPDGFKRSRFVRQLPAQDAAHGFGKFFGADDFVVQRQRDFGAIGVAQNIHR